MSDAELFPWDVELRLGPYPPEQREHLRRTLAPEAGSDVPRTQVDLTMTSEGDVRIHIAAGGTAVLRAALNAYLRWTELAGRVEAIAEARAPRR